MDSAAQAAEHEAEREAQAVDCLKAQLARAKSDATLAFDQHKKLLEEEKRNSLEAKNNSIKLAAELKRAKLDLQDANAAVERLTQKLVEAEEALRKAQEEYEVNQATMVVWQVAGVVSYRANPAAMITYQIMPKTSVV